MATNNEKKNKIIKTYHGDKPTSEAVREIYLNSGLSANKIGMIIGVSKNTIETWIAGIRNPPAYIVDYIKNCLEEYNDRVTNNAEVIRKMNNEKLANFLSDIRDDALFAKGKEAKVKSEYKSFDDFLLSTSLLPEFTLSKKKVNNRITTTKSDANDKSRCKEIRDLYTASGMTQAELSKLTGITENTLSNWIIGKKQPATYVVNHIKMCISKYNKIETNNGDWVRQMDNDTLAEFLAEIRDNALKTKGVEGDVREEFKSFDDFLESTSHVSNYRTSKCGSLI